MKLLRIGGAVSIFGVGLLTGIFFGLVVLLWFGRAKYDEDEAYEKGSQYR